MELPKVNLDGVLGNNSDFAKSESQLLIHSPMKTSVHLINLDSDTTPAIGAPIDIKPIFNLPLYGFEVTHSCNGLLLLEGTIMGGEVHRCIVCNPVTGEYIILPDSIHLSKNVKCAFFVFPSTHQFKVFRAFHQVLHPNPDSDLDSSPELDLPSYSSMELDLFSDSDLYTKDSSLSSDSGSDSYSNFDSDSDSDSDTDSMYSEYDRMGEFFVGGSDSWESVSDLPLPFSPFSIYSPCYLHESTHWLCINEYVPNIVVFFNFETHEFGDFLTPAPIEKDHMYARDDMSLVVLGGCLAIFDGFTTRGEFHIWAMKEYGVWDSWSKDYVIDTKSWGVYGLNFCYKPVMCRKNGEVVMVCGDGYVVLYDMVKKSGRIMRCQEFGVLDTMKAVAHTPSIMSLRDALGGGNMAVLNVASRSGQT